MAKFIDAYRQPSPIAQAIGNFGQSLFGDRITPQLKQEQLYAAQRKNDAIDVLTAQLGETAGTALAAGASPGEINLYTQATNPDNDLFGEAIARSVVAAGGNYGSTPRAYNENQTRQAQESAARLAEQARQADASLAETSRNNRARLSEGARQFDSDQSRRTREFNGEFVPFVDPATGMPGQITREQYLSLLEQRSRNGNAPLAPITSLTEAQGGLALRQIANGELTPAEQKEATNARIDDKVERFIDDQGNAYVSVDGGRTDMISGGPIPAKALRLGTAGSQAAGGPESVLTKPNQTKVQSEAMSLRNFQGQLSSIRQMAQKLGPAGFGPAGAARRLKQTVFEIAGGLDVLFGGQEGGFLDTAKTTFNSVPVGSDDGTLIQARRDIFDPNLPNIERAANLLAYSAAAALAGQEGRGLSDNDFKVFRSRIVRDPTSFFGSQQGFLAGLDFLEAEVARAAATNKMSRGGDLDTPAPAAPPKRMRWNPQTNQIEPVQ